MRTPEHLSELQFRVFAHLNMNFGADVAIADMFRVAYPALDAPATTRAKQQRLGHIISTLNRKLEGNARIVPGVRKQTYRMITAKDA